MVILETIKAVKDGTDGYKLELYAKTNGGGVVKVATLAGDKIGLLKPTTITGTVGELLSVGANYDISENIGKGKMGFASGGTPGSFYISHYNNFNSTEYALRIHPDFTSINTKSTGAVYISADENNTIATFVGNKIDLLKPTSINGATIGTHKLAVNGTTANTTGVWATISDEAVKENIKDVSNPIDKVLKIANCVKQYNYITETGIEQNQRTQFIAQMLIENGFKGHVSESDPMNEDVGRILGWEYADEEYTETETDEKEVVKTRRVVTKEGRQQYSVEQNLTPYLFPAFAELKKENDELKERLSIIEKKLGI